MSWRVSYNTVKPVFSGHSKRRPKSLNAGQKYCRMLLREHSTILSTFIKLAKVIKIFVLSIFEWPLKTGFTVKSSLRECGTYQGLDISVRDFGPYDIFYILTHLTYRANGNKLWCALVIWSSLQLTSEQLIIKQQFTAGADLFLNLLGILTQK